MAAKAKGKGAASSQKISFGKRKRGKSQKSWGPKAQKPKKYRGQGLAKFWWSLVCCRLFADGFDEVSSSVSAANLAVLNLYASLGFKFKEATDVYHKLIN